MSDRNDIAPTGRATGYAAFALVSAIVSRYRAGMRTISQTELETLLGRPLPIAGQTGLALTPTRVEPNPLSLRAGGGFSVELTGPLQPILNQGTYTFESEEPFEMFIVPIAQDANGTTYQAIFG